METIGATEARANFAELLRRVSTEGERIVIERRGKPRAVLVPLGEEERDEPRAARASWRNTGALFDETERLARLGHWEWDEVEDRCVYCSEELARLHGVTVEKYLRRASSLAADLEWVHPEDRQRYQDVTNRLREEGKGFEIEYRLRQPDGGYLEVREEAEPVCDEQGSVIRSFGFVQDITERKQAERELHRINAWFNKTESLAKLGHLEWDWIEDRCTYCSDELARLHGVTAEQYIEQATFEADSQWVHPEDRAAYGAWSEGMVRQDKEYEIEYRLLQPGGGWIEVREVVELEFDDAGTVVRSFGFVQDLTERKQAERGLRESAALLSQAAEMANLGHWVWDEIEDRCVHCSETLAQINGLTVEEYLANYATMEALLAGIFPEDRSRYQRVIDEAKREQRAYDVEFRDVKPDGEVLYLRERGEPVFDAAGRHVRTVGTLQDITEHRQAERDLRRARDELEQRVAERTADLQMANEALREEEAKLRAILENSPVGVAIVSHNMDGTRLTGDRLFINSAMVQMFGAASRESFINAKIEDTWVSKEQLN
jgi:prevent-host-death family protein